LLYDWLKLLEKRTKVRTRERIGESELIRGLLTSDVNVNVNDWNYTTSTATVNCKQRIRKDTEEADLTWLGYCSKIPKKIHESF
jgi:SHS2 domain-containing protein